MGPQDTEQNTPQKKEESEKMRLLVLAVASAVCGVGAHDSNTTRRQLQTANQWQANCAAVSAAGIRADENLCLDVDPGAWHSTIDFSGYDHAQACEV